MFLNHPAVKKWYCMSKLLFSELRLGKDIHFFCPAVSTVSHTKVNYYYEINNRNMILHVCHKEIPALSHLFGLIAHL